MTTERTRAALRRWAAGKHITKAQLEDLNDQGYITTIDNGESRVTPAGTRLITGKDTH